MFHVSYQNANCKRGVCLNGGICQPNYDNDSYSCMCVGRFSGVHCEKNKGEKFVKLHHLIYMKKYLKT